MCHTARLAQLPSRGGASPGRIPVSCRRRGRPPCAVSATPRLSPRTGLRGRRSTSLRSPVATRAQPESRRLPSRHRGRLGSRRYGQPNARTEPGSSRGRKSALVVSAGGRTKAQTGSRADGDRTSQASRPKSAGDRRRIAPRIPLYGPAPSETDLSETVPTTEHRGSHVRSRAMSHRRFAFYPTTKRRRQIGGKRATSFFHRWDVSGNRPLGRRTRCPTFDQMTSRPNWTLTEEKPARRPALVEDARSIRSVYFRSYRRQPAKPIKPRPASRA